MTALLLIVPLAPLTAALLIRLLAGRMLQWSGWVAVAGGALSVGALALLGGASPRADAVWFTSGPFTLTVGLQFDGLARLMAWIVAAVGLLITIYAVTYMADEQRQPYFFSCFSFFIGAMLLLVLADSMVLLFVAWEMVGLASFLLIGFWHTQTDARAAAQKAFLLTRLGDLGMLLGWLLALYQTGTTDIGALLTAVPNIAPATLTLIALLFLCGAAGKSAQLPLTAWLPDAMAGPTPVSALMHSATMVAAGVYLLVRLFLLFAAAPGALAVVLWIGGLTALFAALVATAQTDIKRVLAWSTVSQLGEMMLALGLAGPLAAAYHLAAHATFKSTLFLTAGALDHATGTRDLHKLGGLARAMPWTAAIFGVAALALAGVFPFSGFWSEDTILARAANVGVAPAALLVLLIFLAGTYSGRAGMAAFGRWPDMPDHDAHDPGWLMRAPMVVLALGALGLGWLLHGWLEQVLALRPPPEVSLAWRVGAVLAGLAGLAFGAWRVRQQGPVPAFGGWPAVAERGLQVATAAPVRAAFIVAHAVDSLDRGFDTVARSAGSLARGLAQATTGIERGLNSGAHELADASLQIGYATEANETRGIAAAVDRMAGLLSRAGGQLRRTETGKIYLYTIGVFVWVLALGVVGGLMFLR